MANSGFSPTNIPISSDELMEIIVSSESEQINNIINSKKNFKINYKKNKC